MTTISTNATGNIIPAGYQISSMFPDKIDYKKGVMIAGVISFMIMPWKLMENPDSIYRFLDLIGALMGPIAGVMISHYFLVIKQKLNMDKLYDKDKTPMYKNGVNTKAFVITLLAAGFALGVKFIPPLVFLANISWIISFAIAFGLYAMVGTPN